MDPGLPARLNSPSHWTSTAHLSQVVQLVAERGVRATLPDPLCDEGPQEHGEAHHGSDLGDFVRSLERIRDCDAEWLLPSHGPVFRNDPELLNTTIERLQGYSQMADFGTCAVEWPLMDEWEQELADDSAYPNS